jgi:hypothetical protein
MRSAKLALLDAFGDAIVAQLVTDAITAPVVTNPTQGGAYPYVVVLPATENDLFSSKGHNNSNLTVTVRAYSDSMTEALQVADTINKAVGRDIRLTLASPFYHVSTSLEANDMLPERRPEGDIYGALLVFRMQVGHINA